MAKLIVELGPGRGERLNRIFKKRPDWIIKGADFSEFRTGGYDEFDIDARDGLLNRNKYIAREPFHVHLEKYEDNSIDQLISDFSAGYYNNLGGRTTSGNDKFFSKTGLDYFQEIANLAFRKLKTSNASDNGKTSGPKRFFAIRVQDKDNSDRLIEAMKKAGFVVRSRVINRREIKETDWTRAMDRYVDTRKIIQIYGYKRA